MRDVVPKVHAHLSAFSAPRRSYQALRSGSVTASSSSCAMIDAMPSAPALPFGPIVCAAQRARAAVGVADERVLDVGAADRAVRVPAAVLRAEAGRRGDVGRGQHEVDAVRVLRAARPLVIAFDTTAWIAASVRRVPCE